jgi:hypothetical protein
MTNKAALERIWKRHKQEVLAFFWAQHRKEEWDRFRTEAREELEIILREIEEKEA